MRDMVLTPEQIKDARQILRLTQRQLAMIIGVKLNTVGKWECGIAECAGPPATLIRLLVAKNKDGKVREWLGEVRAETEKQPA